MKIVQINTDETRGGASIAALRLNHNLNQWSTISSEYLVLNKQNSMSSTRKNQSSVEDQLFFQCIQEYYLNKFRISSENSLFSLFQESCALNKETVIHEADIVHLHWIYYYLNPEEILKLYLSGKKIVWTFHDMRAMTGGCHYAGDCQRYHTFCENCPQLKQDPLLLVHQLFQNQKECFQKMEMTIIVPSLWMKKCVEKSAIFMNKPVEVIKNSVPIHQFYPLGRSKIRKKFHIKQDAFVLLFVANDLHEKRKGWSYLKEILFKLKENRQLKQFWSQKLIQIMIVGDNIKHELAMDENIHYIPYVDSISKLNEIYNNADIFMLPSTEDNLPNTMLESLSSGTPVMAFRSGGIPDLIQHGYNGYLFNLEDVNLWVQTLTELILNKTRLILMRKNCRIMIMKECHPVEQAQKHVNIYAQLLEQKKSIDAVKYYSGWKEFYPKVLYYALGHYFKNPKMFWKSRVKKRKEGKMKSWLRNWILGFLIKNIDEVLDHSQKLKLVEKALEIKNQN